MTTASPTSPRVSDSVSSSALLARGRSPLMGALVRALFRNDREYKRFGASLTSDGLRDFLLASEDEPHDPIHVFRTLRWGGQFVYASLHRSRVRMVAEQFRGQAFILEREPAFVTRAIPWFPLLGRKIHYFIARKVHLTRPGEFTDRFTYNVELVHRHRPGDGDLIVCKRVPDYDSVLARLRRRWPDAAAEVLERRARKFTDKIFPTFLTREAAILKIVQEHLPSRYAARVPHIIEVEKDIRGFVTSLKMNWLRNGGAPLSQLEFAMQSADLLRALHDAAAVIHLDLRLDNMVITEQGVGFVDFGSSVRMGEDLSANPLLDTLFEELMRTSQIQKMLLSMTRSGEVTAQHLCTQQGRVDKAVDLFFLALQFTTPHANPDLAGLIHYEPESPLARELAALSAKILRPADPSDTTHRSAKDILRSLELIEKKLQKKKT